MRNHKFKGEKHPNWKGGAYVTASGRFVYMPGHPLALSNGYAPEHRLVAAPRPDEVVHHKDHDPSNNAKKNLEPMTRARHAHLHYVEAGGKPLTRADYNAIKSLQGVMSQNHIARRFGITQIRVSRIFRDTGIYVVDE